MNAKPGAGGWRPDAQMLQWTRGLIASMKDGGTWVVPANGNVYFFDKGAKVLRFVLGRDDALHQRTVVTFGALGWSVRDERGGGGAVGDPSDEIDLAESAPVQRQLGLNAGRGAQAARLLRRRV